MYIICCLYINRWTIHVHYFKKEMHLSANPILQIQIYCWILVTCLLASMSVSMMVLLHAIA